MARNKTGNHKQTLLMRGAFCFILDAIHFPEMDTFDIDVHRCLTRKQTNEVKAYPEKYHFLPKTSNFDFLDLHINLFYDMNFRVVRLKISEDSYECIITNLDRESFPPEKIKKLYHMRWGIETSFRDLKHTIGLSHFHSKKVEFIKQEIFARLILYTIGTALTDLRTHIRTLQSEHIQEVVRQMKP